MRPAPRQKSDPLLIALIEALADQAAIADHDAATCRAMHKPNDDAARRDRDHAPAREIRRTVRTK